MTANAKCHTWSPLRIDRKNSLRIFESNWLTVCESILLQNFEISSFRYVENALIVSSETCKEV